MNECLQVSRNKSIVLSLAWNSLKALARRVVLLVKAFFLKIASGIVFAVSMLGYITPFRRLRELRLLSSTMSYAAACYLKDMFVGKKAGDGLYTCSSAVPLSLDQWTLNVALLREAYEKTDDPELKDVIQFLALNYQDKSAPYDYVRLRKFSEDLDEMFDYGRFSGSEYYRESFCSEFDCSRSLGKNLALADRSPLIPTDTSEVEGVLSLYFDTITVDDMREKLKSLLQKKDRKACLEKPFLIDLTSSLGDAIYSNEQEVNRQLIVLRKRLDKMIAEVAREMHVGKRELLRFVRKQTTVIARVKLDRGAGIKVLPLWTKLEKKSLLKTCPQLIFAVWNSGIYMNRITMRHVVNDTFRSCDASYSPRGRNTEFDVKAIRAVRMWGVARKTFYGKDIPKECATIGQAALELVEGIFSEVDLQKFNEDEAKRMVIHTSIYRIFNELAFSILYAKDFQQLSRHIERIHNELTTLLTITKPYKATDFEQIYLDRVRPIISERCSVQAGLAKTAMNVFTGLRVAVRKTTAHPVEAHCLDIYFEEKGKRSLQDLVDDRSIDHVDFYATQFYGNIELDSDKTHYEPVDVIGDIEKLLKAKPNTRRLTIAIDTTIDQLNSSRLQEVLHHFESQILSGQLNFVIFRSGQKFDYLGVDNYYGAPFIIINNGDAFWEPFNSLRKDPAYQTDDLTHQWFCHSNRYCYSQMNDYRSLIFAGHREVLMSIPSQLVPKKGKEQRVRVNTVSDDMLSSFIDIKVTGIFHRLRSKFLLSRLYFHSLRQGVKIHSRPSFGFCHLNVLVINAGATSTSSSIRINVGLDHREIQVVHDFLQDVASCS